MSFIDICQVRCVHYSFSYLGRKGLTTISDTKERDKQ